MPHSRQILLTLIVILNLSFHLSTYGQTTAKGVVFEDINQNGIRDNGEPGLKNVGVSNGVDVVQTDGHGAYELSIGDDNIIFVIKPRDYTFRVNAFQQPMNYYIHKPKGSPNTKYSGVSPTGCLPESIDFALIPKKENDNYEILVFGDPQPYTLEEVHYFNKGIVSELVGIEGFEFGISLGDLVGDDLTLFYPYLHAVSRIGIPWYHVYGNHDMNFDAPSDDLADETFEAVFGPANFSFNYGKAHFIVLDDVLYPDPRDGRGYWGGFRKDQLEFIKNDLQYVPKDHLVIVNFHIPIIEYDGGDQFRDEDRDALFSLLQDFENTLSLSAHTHIQMHDFFDSDRGWHGTKPHHHYNVGTTSGDWYSGDLDSFGTPNSRMRDGTPKGIAKLSISGNRYTFDYKPSGWDWNKKMDIHAPLVVPEGPRNRARIIVNFFQGCEKDSLFFRVDQGEWKNMSKSEIYDPMISKIQYEWDFMETIPEGTRPSLPILSSHIWTARLPNHLGIGTHDIDVKVVDFMGRTFTQSSTYKIVEGN